MMNADPSKNGEAAPPQGSRPASTKDDDELEMEDAQHEVDEGASSSKRSKKKRRVIKITDKKYECPQPDCHKSYSRAEHLYRHQLNHTPKQIYVCDHPGCDRSFVRADLCARHKERHTAKGSHLQRKDAFLHSQRQQHGKSVGTNGYAPTGATNNITTSPVDSAHPSQQPTYQDQQSQYMTPVSQHNTSPYTTGGDQQHYSEQSQPNQLPPLHSVQTGAAPGGNQQLAAVGSYSAYPGTSFNNGQTMSAQLPTDGRRYSLDSKFDRHGSMTNGYAQPLPMQPPQAPGQQVPVALYAQETYQSQSSASQSQQYQSPTVNPALPPLPGFAANAISPDPMPPVYPYQMGDGVSTNVMPHYDLYGNYTGTFDSSMPVFVSDGYNHSPQNYNPDWMRDVLENGQLDVPPSPPDAPYPPYATHATHAASVPLSKVEPIGARPDEHPANHVTEKSPEIYAMDLSMRESGLSEKKQNRLIAMVNSWGDDERMPGRMTKKKFLSGDISDPKHPLSMEMLKTYLTSFWIHIHLQMPIMHRPSFNADTCPDLLLLAMMCLGACCLDRTHTRDHIKICAELAFFCAYHIRWEVFKEPDFRPTAKLWTFQTMLLLELFEKMYSTRALHERAHVHHATTLTVMRRGSSLIGRGATDEALSDPTRTPPGPDGSINTSGQNTSDPWWNRWITQEATLRVAYAAFVIDSTHATLFGHSAIMSPQDVRLPLPCDESTWDAPSGADVQRTEASLANYGVTRVTFLDGLKKMLSGQHVVTNVFGRVVLMAGLLNVTWHMNNRDLQVNAINSPSSMGNPDKWRMNLIRAFEFWRRDFDEYLAKKDAEDLAAKTAEGDMVPVKRPSNASNCHGDHKDNVFESRTCLHSLAHMAMHVSIVECEMFAGAERALGRLVIEADRVTARKKMGQWAQTARARDAVFYALKFLREVLMPESNFTKPDEQRQVTAAFTYSARDDYLLNRPYILYFACMIVWAYGYALDGPIVTEKHSLVATEAQLWDMQLYLSRLGRITSPDDLMKEENHNRVVGLLMLVHECFNVPRWELLHQASEMLESCMELLWPGINKEWKEYKKQQAEQEQQQQQKHHHHHQQQQQH